MKSEKDAMYTRHDLEADLKRLGVDPDRPQVRLPDGSLQSCPMLGHDTTAGDISSNYGKLLRPFIALSACVRGKVGDARAVLCDARRMVAVTTRFLARDPQLFRDGAAVPRSWYR